MKTLSVVVILLASTLPLMSCASGAPLRPSSRTAMTATRVVALYGSSASVQPREVRVLADESAFKLVSIALRKGTVLPEHRAPVPVSVQALQGSGTVTAGAERFRIDPGHAVVLAPNVKHAVKPDSVEDLLLLVHYLGRKQEAQK